MGDKIKMPREDTVKTRKSLLEAACEIFAQKGYRDTTIAEISKRAGQTSQLSIITSKIKKPFMSKHGDVLFTNPLKLTRRMAALAIMHWLKNAFGRMWKQPLEDWLIKTTRNSGLCRGNSPIPPDYWKK